MTLGRLIERLKEVDGNKVVPLGFDYPHSWRGDYAQLSFSPKENVKVSDMLKDAKRGLVEAFEGYKGGEYRMNKYTTVYLAPYGECGEELGELSLNYILGIKS